MNIHQRQSDPPHPSGRPARRGHRRAATGILTVGLAASALAATSVDAAPKPRVSLTAIGTYETGQYDESATEIVAHDPSTQRLFVVNAQKGAIDVLDISTPGSPHFLETLESQTGGGVNSVAVSDGVLAIAVQDPASPTFPGTIELYSTDGTFLSSVVVGALPDMVTFTPDGTKLVVANEGEPDNYCADGAGDPEGSVSIIDVSDGAATVTQADVETAGFAAFNGDIDALRAGGVRIFGPNASVAQDLEPEYVAIDADSTTAWVSLQENNAFAVIDLASATVTDILPLGFKDHSLPGNGLDASNRDDGINIRTWPVHGMYMPDAIDAYEFGGQTYLVSANEGDARDYDCFSEEARIKDLTLDPTVFLNASDLQADDQLGRLKTTTSFNTTVFEMDGDQFVPVATPSTELYTYGARSFSIWAADGTLVFDSGDQLEQITAGMLPADFNSTNDENGSFDSRSDDKGPEPEGVVIAELYSKTYAFIGLERVGGVMVYDITTPKNPKFVQYVNNRDFTGDAEAGTAGDLGPEGLTVITPDDSPNGKALLVVGNEVSGTVTIYEIAGPGTAR
ncbi:MAG: 2',3'-cyclic-nucleotide 2'-phosphodiesterase/3'-nucleotidase/5'-nucleotidase [Ilumatobacter sp.]|jgi:2',3'-cyclic-nucleotide 2'-phosphodiesterase/3'-nucleotidase/5'-nucleotidase